MILLIDNYDSFTYNLQQYVETLGVACEVRRNDAISIAEIRARPPAGIILSPGPGNPDSAGITLAVIRELAGTLPILGVCLGHQAIGQAFGGRVVRAPKPKHGKVSEIRHAGAGVFAGAANPLRVARYHSLIVERSSLPACLEVTAETSADEGGIGTGIIMGLRHREYDVEGVQFHPESIATEGGPAMIAGFLRRTRTL